MTNYQIVRSMTVEELAAIMMCPNETGLAELECDSGNCFQCCLDWLKRECDET